MAVAYLNQKSFANGKLERHFLFTKEKYEEMNKISSMILNGDEINGIDELLEQVYTEKIRCCISDYETEIKKKSEVQAIILWEIMLATPNDAEPIN